MVPTSNRPTERIALRTPIIAMVLAATVIPIELRPLSHATLDFGLFASDVIENIAGYIPLGIVLAGLGPLRGGIAAALISLFAETSQFGMMHREPSVFDFASNVIGAILGITIGVRWRIRSAEFLVTTSRALVAAILGFVLFLSVWAYSGTFNSRGATTPGTLEAYWNFDESRGDIAKDSSGHGFHGRFHNHAKRVPGVIGRAIALDGATDYIHIGTSSGLRLVGSMTITAWIKATSFPVDDAAIVSNHNGLGYQLDTTVDRGPRTIGFKLADLCGNLMARYGATPLATNIWYHVAGVYNAEAQTLDVYLNGKLDNGFLLGSVTGMQRSSRKDVDIGRRSDAKGFEFAGSIDDVRIYSLALTGQQVAADMHGRTKDVLAMQRSGGKHIDTNGHEEAHCAVLSDREDARIPGAAAVLGVLAAIACIGLLPGRSLLLCLAAGLAAGLGLVPVTASSLPWFTRWMMPIISLAGGVSVAVSVRDHNKTRRMVQGRSIRRESRATGCLR